MARKKYSGSNDPHIVEWVVGTICACLVLLLVAFVAFEALTNRNAPPRLTVSTLAGLPGMAKNEVRFEVFNTADTTAAAVVVRGALTGDGNSEETAEVTFDYVPARSSAKGSLIFNSTTEGKELKIYAVGYVDP
ncbi:TIGR02588 family protein [Rhizobium cauense]|uniref:TIGR02588 family protein n=1 Tax=Rhizobium cauense TaxID=1166683 RepID=UPI001C6DEAA3|nr:TIGR02588 family protein [Rhizobium cauense]MBW9118120.1 TIGR02588 family protein [Rhizobium cauense]